MLINLCSCQKAQIEDSFPINRANASSRVICLYASVFLLLFYTTWGACITIVPVLEEYRIAIQDVLDQLTTLSQVSSGRSEFTLPNLTGAFVCAILTSLLITVVQVLILLANIRKYRSERNPNTSTTVL